MSNGSDTPDAARLRAFELVIFLASLVIYLALAVWMTNTWRPLGDEPHYLIAAHSLVVDHDLSLANNYAETDLPFTNGDPLDPHVKILSDGTFILNHDLGLPLVIALPYALGGRLGVELFLAVCAALLAWQMFKLAYDVTHNLLGSAVSTAALAFTPPLVLYATLIYPELLGALIFLWATRTILFKPVQTLSPVRLIALAVSMAFLPWLSIRFVVLLTLLIIFIALRWSSARPQLLLAYAVLGIGFVAYLFVNNILLAGTVPKGNPTELAGSNLVTLSLASLSRGVLGWWLDPQRGTLIMAPVYLLALAGIPRLLRANFARGILLISPLLILVPMVAVLGGFWIPFEVGARYFVVALPLLAAPLALALQSIFRSRAVWPRLALGGLALVLVGLSFVNGALMITDPSYAYGSVVSAYSRVVGTDLSPLFASMGHGLYVTPDNSRYPETAQITHASSDAVDAAWRFPPGSVGTYIQSDDLSELTVGHYLLHFRAQPQAAAQNDSALVLDLFSPEGLALAHAEWSAKELSSDSPSPLALEFDNPYFDRWGFPLTLQLIAVGDAGWTITALEFDPDNSTTWLRVGIWLGLLLGITVLLNLDLVRGRHSSALPVAASS